MQLRYTIRLKVIVMIWMGTLWVGNVAGQSNKMPIKLWASEAEKPLVFYLTGDGGFNNFSLRLCAGLNKAGYSVCALNTRSYFWNKKTESQAAEDISQLLARQLRPGQTWGCIGYSFGADVLPFVVDRLSPTIRQTLLQAVLIAPSATTDFEIHLTDLLGSNNKYSKDVVAAMNKMGALSIATVLSGNEKDFPVQQIRLKNYNNYVMKGNHHFDGNIDEVTALLVKLLKSK
ncbi:MAG: AcvB/VirJ family lysyl-phosphatidylglycerol hydrolase [Niabella sp.]